MTASIPAAQTLKAVVLLEKDTNGDVLTWTFPAIEKPLENVLKSRSGLLDVSASAAAAAAGGAAAAAANAAADLAECPFRFSRFGAQWLYQLSVPLTDAAARARKVTHVSICIVTGGPAAYFVNKYSDLLRVMLKAFQDGEQSPTALLSVYLSVLTTNKYEGPAGKFDEATYDARRAMIAPLKFLIQTYGADSITIWLAMLLRKRIFVYHPRTSEVQSLIKIFPLLGAWHRQDVSLLRPFVTLSSPAEIEDLKAAGVYVAGFTDPDCISRKDLYDLYIDAQTKTFTFGAGAEVGSTDGRPPAFALSKFHRTTAESFVAAAASETDQGVIKAVATATKEFLDKIQALKAQDPSGSITSEGLAAAGLPQAMQTFIYNVATAEGLTKKA